MGKICHRGVVVGAGAGVLRVRIVGHGACGACSAAGVCGMGERRMKTIVLRYDGDKIDVGREVNVFSADSNGLMGVFYAFAVPLAVMLATLFTTHTLTGNEAVAAVAALTALMLYYLFLYVFGKRLCRCFRFHVETVL